MSRLLTDEVGVFISPHRLALVRINRSLRSTLSECKTIAVAGTDEDDWQAPLDALISELDDSCWHSAAVKIVVANNWARYEVLPWSVDLNSESERMEHARLLMSKTYGSLLDDWTLTLSVAAPGQMRIITALPSELVRNLLALSDFHGLRVTSIQPQLIAAFNSWRHHLPQASSWFASIDDGSLAALHIVNGRCDRVRSVRLSDNWAVELDRIKTMGRLSKDRAADGPVFVDAPGRLRDMAADSHSEIHWLEGRRAAGGTLAYLDTQMERPA